MSKKISKALPMENGKKLSTSNYNTGWSIMKGMIYFFGLVALGAMTASVLFAYQTNQAALHRAYVVTNQGTIIAETAAGDIDAREIEVRNHVTLFMKSMYSFDERSFEKNVERALNLIGDDGLLIANEYKRAKTLEQLIKTNGIISLEVDSMWTAMDNNPYKVRVFARQNYETSLSKMSSRIWADMHVKNVSRSVKNVHGLLIENFNIIKNEPIRE